MGDPLKVLGVCPLDCPDTCGWEVTVEDGVATGLHGNPGHPFTRGALCVKVNRWLEHAAAPDRITHPMRRVGPKGEGRFERITWDEALEEIATRLTAITEEHGGKAIWPYWGTGSLGYLQGANGLSGQRLFNVLGASRHHFTICSIAGGPTVTLHPDDAAARGLTEGQKVLLVNDRGSFAVVLRISADIRQGVAATTKGHWAKLSGGANANILVDERDADMGGGAVYHDTRVDVRPG